MKKEFISYSEASIAAKERHVASLGEWHKCYKEILGAPAWPNKIYKEWVNWATFGVKNKCVGSEGRVCDQDVSRKGKRCDSCRLAEKKVYLTKWNEYRPSYKRANRLKRERLRPGHDRAVNSAWYLAHPGYDQTRKIALKFEVLSHYCGGELRCQCLGCPLRALSLLTIDHVNGDGHKHRNGKKRRLGGSALYCWLRENGYPDGFQTLCGACNLAKRNKSRCPAYGTDHTKTV